MARPNKARSIGGEANLARRIAREREARGLSYDALARLMTDAGCSIVGSALYKVEKGTPPRRVAVDELIALARVFEFPVEELLVPVETLDKQRAQELMNELDDSDLTLWKAAARLYVAQQEMRELARADPELAEYVEHRMNSRAIEDDPLIKTVGIGVTIPREAALKLSEATLALQGITRMVGHTSRGETE